MQRARQQPPLPRAIEHEGAGRLAGHGAAVRWQRRLTHVVVQSPLLVARSATAGVARPTSVFVGLGVCHEAGVSRGVPFDLLGLLLPAERVRRAVGATRLDVLIADAHALAVGHRPRAVERQAAALEDVLSGLRHCGVLPRVRVERATALHATAQWRDSLARVEARVPPERTRYARLQLADMEVLRARGATLKVGWTLGPQGGWDERAFDACFAEVGTARMAFAYAKPGRTLCGDRPRAVPYVVRDPLTRLRLGRDDDVRDYLERASLARRSVRDGVRRHLRATTRVFRQLGAQVDGSLCERLEHVRDRIFPAVEGRVRAG